MATGIFTLRNQLLGLIQKAWTGKIASTYQGSFNSSTTYLTTPSSSAFAFGTGNWTVEGWMLPTTAYNLGAGVVSIGAYSVGIDIRLNETTSNQFGVYIASGTFHSVTFTSFNTWNHFAIVKNSGTITIYVNGVSSLSFADSTSFSTNPVYIGKVQSGTTYYSTFLGYLSNIRITNTAVYTSAFTPSTSPLTAISGTQLLTLQNSSIVDNSSNAFTITNNGSTTTSIAYPFSVVNTATPAVEYLVVAGGGGGGGVPSSQNYAGGGGGAGGLLAGVLSVVAGTSYTVTVGAGGSAGPNTSVGYGGNGADSVFGSITSKGGGGGGGGNDGTYGPGRAGGSGGGGSGQTANGASGAGTSGQGNSGGIGKDAANSCSGGGGGAGTVGISFSASASPCNGGAGIASAISGTVTTYAGGGGGSAEVTVAATGGVGGGGNGNGGANGSAGSANTGGGGGGGARGFAGGTGGSGIAIISYPDTYNAPTTLTGTYTASTSGSGSLSFNGSSQYITTPTSSNLALGTSNFSVEAWVYKTSTSGNQLAIGSSVTGNLDPILLYFNTGSNNAVLYLSSNGSTFDIASAVSIGTVSLNTWAHLAVTRVGSTFTTYLNGAQTSTFTSSASIYKSVNTFTIGAGQTSINYFNGYISNVRIVIGASAYSAPFTPSITPLTPITNTQLLLNTVSGAQFVDSSTNSFASTITGSPTWNQLSPFATGLGYKNRVYTWTGSGTVTF